VLGREPGVAGAFTGIGIENQLPRTVFAGSRQNNNPHFRAEAAQRIVDRSRAHRDTQNRVEPFLREPVPADAVVGLAEAGGRAVRSVRKAIHHSHELNRNWRLAREVPETGTQRRNHAIETISPAS
jgi:hypothetical protein